MNGIEADAGAAEREVYGGDRVWWDYRDWSAAMRVPAVVGSFPEPFLHGVGGQALPGADRLRARTRPTSATRSSERLDRAGVAPSIAALGASRGDELLRVVVGEWEDVRGDSAAQELEEGPARERRVRARAAAAARATRSTLLDAQGRVVRTLGPGAGIVAATRFEEQQPTWVVSGTDAAGLDRAVRLLGRARPAQPLRGGGHGSHGPLAAAGAPGRSR